MGSKIRRRSSAALVTQVLYSDCASRQRGRMQATFQEAQTRRSAAVMFIAPGNPGWDLTDGTRAPLRDPKTLVETDGQPDGYHEFLRLSSGRQSGSPSRGRGHAVGLEFPGFLCSLPQGPCARRGWQAPMRVFRRHPGASFSTSYVVHLGRGGAPIRFIEYSLTRYRPTS